GLEMCGIAYSSYGHKEESVVFLDCRSARRFRRTQKNDKNSRRCLIGNVSRLKRYDRQIFAVQRQSCPTLPSGESRASGEARGGFADGKNRSNTLRHSPLWGESSLERGEGPFLGWEE